MAGTIREELQDDQALRGLRALAQAVATHGDDWIGYLHTGQVPGVEPNASTRRTAISMEPPAWPSHGASGCGSTASHATSGLARSLLEATPVVSAQVLGACRKVN